MSASKTRHPEKRLTPLEGAVTSTHKRQWCGLEEGVDDGGERLGCSVGRKGQQPMINTSKAVSKLQLQCREIESGWGGKKKTRRTSRSKPRTACHVDKTKQIPSSNVKCMLTPTLTKNATTSENIYSKQSTATANKASSKNDL